MSETTNGDRAVMAARQLGKLIETVFAGGEIDEGDVLEFAGDLLADVFHLARVAGVTPEELVSRAETHFYAEIEGD